MKKLLFALITFLSLCLLSCTPKLNGKMVGGLYDKGITTEAGKQIPIAGYAKEGATVFYMVRHAEKEKGKDPGLTEAGTNRAKKLGQMLEDVRLTGIYSTKRKRTIYTAAPTAELHKREVDSYDYKKQGELIEGLKKRKGEKFLIVGHSNSIPELLNLFQEKKVYDHIDESVYDNFYIVVISANDDCEIIELKY